MAVLAWPDVIVRQFTPLMFPSQVVNPTLGGTEEVLEVMTRLGALFVLPILLHDEYGDVDGFLAELRGAIGTAAVPFLHYRAKRGSGTGSPTVASAVAEGATQIPSTSWTGADPRLKRGAMITISTSIGGVTVPRAYRIRQDANTTTPTLAVWPPVKDALAGGEAIEYAPDVATDTYIRSTMRLRRPDDPQGEVFPSGGAPSNQFMRGLAIEFIEAVRADYTV